MPYVRHTQPCRFQKSDPLALATIRLSRRQMPVFREALMELARSLHSKHEYQTARKVMHFIKTLPECAPYDVHYTGHDWVLISLALRPLTTTPKAGTPAMRYRTIYAYFRKHTPFSIK